MRASHFIMAGNQILHSVYPFSKLHGEDGGNWIGLIHKIVTWLQICQFYCIASQKYTLGFRFQSNPNKVNNKITELRTILQRESQN